MKSIKLKLFEYRKDLNIEQADVATIVSEHMDLCEEYSEKEILRSLQETLEPFKFYENVNPFLNDLDDEIKQEGLLYSLKDLYAKIARKENRFLYETALSSLVECINQPTDEDRQIKILNNLKMYEWINEIRLFLLEQATTPQTKQNFISGGAKIDDVFSIVLQVKEGYLTYIAEHWVLLSDDGIQATLLENHISDDVQLKKMRLLEEAVNRAEFTSDFIRFKIAEELTVTFDVNTKKILLNESEKEEGTTLESLFNSPVIPFVGKGFYPILNETFNNLDKFMNIDTVKKVHNVVNNTFECFVFNYKGKIAQYRMDKRIGYSYYQYENAIPLIENVMHELGADLTFFYEDTLSEELKVKSKLEKQEQQLLEKLTDVENAIIKIKEEKIILNENKVLEKLYHNLLSKKHTISEELKVIKNQKSKY